MPLRLLKSPGHGKLRIPRSIPQSGPGTPPVGDSHRRPPSRSTPRAAPEDGSNRRASLARLGQIVFSSTTCAHCYSPGLFTMGHDIPNVNLFSVINEFTWWGPRRTFTDLKAGRHPHPRRSRARRHENSSKPGVLKLKQTLESLAQFSGQSATGESLLRIQESKGIAIEKVFVEELR
jgi:hypothetical protein